MKLFLTMLLLCHSMVMFAQVDTTTIASVQRDSTIEKMRRLERELQSLKQFVDSQQSESKKKAADIYEANYNKMLHTSELVNELYDAVDLIERDKKEQITYNKINQANNPTSDILGFKLVDVINNTLDETIKENNSKIPEPQKKPIRSIVNNLVLALGKTFPPLQLFTSVVSTISTFTIPALAVDNPDSKVRKVSDVTNNVRVSPAPLDSSFVNSFSNKMGPYITFYLNLNKINTNLEDELNVHSFNYGDMLTRIQQMRSDFEKNTSIDMSGSANSLNALNKLMNYRNSGNSSFRYDEYNSKREVRYVTNLLPDLYDYVKQFNEYSKQYIYIVARNINNNKEQLKLALQLPKSDSSRINALIQEISDKQNGPEGFLTKYNSKIDEINQEIKTLKSNS